MKKKIRIILLIGLLLYFIIGFKNDLQITYYDYSNSKIPAAFDGFKILQISDLHCKSFGTNQIELLQAIRSCEPNIIVLTGDIIDSEHFSIQPVYDLIKELNQQYPIYYVSGNHELEPSAARNYKEMLDLFQSYNVTLLDDSSVTIEKEDATIHLYGQKFRSRYVVHYIEQVNENSFNILLYHGSNFFDLIAPFHYDLVFSGHLHGGAIRLPLIGGLFSPDGTFLPTYDKGMYTQFGSTLIVSAGLGDSKLPRFYNDPELVVVTLHSTSP